MCLFIQLRSNNNDDDDDDDDKMKSNSIKLMGIFHIWMSVCTNNNCGGNMIF